MVILRYTVLRFRVASPLVGDVIISIFASPLVSDVMILVAPPINEVQRYIRYTKTEFALV